MLETGRPVPAVTRPSDTALLLNKTARELVMAAEAFETARLSGEEAVAAVKQERADLIAHLKMLLAAAPATAYGEGYTDGVAAALQFLDAYDGETGITCGADRGPGFQPCHLPRGHLYGHKSEPNA